MRVNQQDTLCYAFPEGQGCSLLVEFSTDNAEGWLAQNVIPWQG
ncbi:hypothetical protein [Saccharibacter sp. 17.LH.SD]|nr:hypothetical protein [Saccharibacter sp. 17.LH.SD]